MGQKAGRMHPSEGLWHLAGLTEGGARVELDNRSSWEVSPGHEIFTAHWTPPETVVVVPGGLGEGYPYDLINQANGDRVPARFCGFDREAEPTGWTFAAE